MRIVFDVSPLSHPRTGVGNYVLGSLAGLAAAGAGRHELVAFAPVSSGGRAAIESALDGLDVERRLPVLPLAHGFRTLWSRVGRPPAERFVGLFDVLHFSDWMYPPQRAGLRSTMVHDLVPLRFPEWSERRTRSLHGTKYRETARACDLVFVNSAYTGRDVVDVLGVPEERVRVAPPGVDSRFSPDGDHASLDRPYALTVATLEPRKNLETLLEAAPLLPDGLVLAVAGGAGWGSQPALDRPRVQALGFVSDEELPRWYRGAAVLVVPSRFEGFGMTVVEAMACGTPCVVSSHPSLDEACGEAAARFDPDDPEALAAAVADALERRDELVALGLEHARRFTWEACGRAMLEAYEAAA